MSAAGSRSSDAHWDTGVPPKSKDVSKEALGAYKTAKLYVRLSDVQSTYVAPVQDDLTAKSVYMRVCSPAT